MRSRALSPVLVLLVAGGLVTGCGGGTKANEPVPKGNVAHGQQLFMNGEQGKRGCVFCHPLAAAGAHAPWAPDLDVIYRQEWKKAGDSEDDLRRIVLDQIENPGTCLYPDLPDHCMPTGLMTDHQDAVDVASFVAQCAGRKGTDGCRPDNGGAAPGSAAARGWQLYTEFRCAGCHSMNGNAPGPDSPEGLAAAVGPSFKGLYGSKVELTNGQTVTADESYLIASIVDPNGQIVRGFHAGVMTEVIPPGIFRPAQLRALVAYIKSLK